MRALSLKHCLRLVQALGHLADVRRQVLDACEQTMGRLATDPRDCLSAVMRAVVAKFVRKSFLE